MSEKSGSDPSADASAPCRARPGFALKKIPTKTLQQHQEAKVSFDHISF